MVRRSGSRTEPYQPRAYAFIDASYLRIDYERTLEKLFGAKPGPMYVKAVGKLLVNRGFDINKVYWYEAEPDEPELGPGEENNEGALARHAREKAIWDAVQNEFEQVANLRSWHVRRGTSSRRRKARDKGRQKEIDVLLACDAIEHAFRGNYEAALILAGDLDFRPMIEVLERLGKTVGTLHGRRSVAQGLREAADVNWAITYSNYYTIAGPEYAKRHKFPGAFQQEMPVRYSGRLDTSKATILPANPFGYPSEHEVVVWYSRSGAHFHVAPKGFNTEFWCELQGREVDRRDDA